MTGQRAHHSAEPADHPLRTALARGERAYASSAPALQYLLLASEHALIAEAVVAQVRAMLESLAIQVVEVQPRQGGAMRNAAVAALTPELMAQPDLRAHCQALALEWRLACRLEAESAIDPALSPRLQAWIEQGDAAIASLAMAALAAQARFVQAQRRMRLPLGELPAELFHLVLRVAQDNCSGDVADAMRHADAILRAEYNEATGRLSLLSRLVREAADEPDRTLDLEQAGVAVWLSALATRSGESRDRTVCATADPHLGRLLLTLRAAGVLPGEAERQALCVQPEAELPRGLHDVGTREAAQWLAEARA